MKARLPWLALCLAIAACGTDPASTLQEPPAPKDTDSHTVLYDDATQRLLAMPAENSDRFLTNARALGMIIQGESVVFELHLHEDSTADEVRHALEERGIAVRRIMEQYHRATVYVRDRAELEALGSIRQIRHITGTGTRYTR